MHCTLFFFVGIETTFIAFAFHAVQCKDDPAILHCPFHILLHPYFNLQEFSYIEI